MFERELILGGMESRPAGSARNTSTAASWDRVLTQTFWRSQERANLLL